MTLRPLGDRILIKPEPNPDTTESGLILMEHRKPETMGTVVAVGTCRHPLHDDAITASTWWRTNGNDELADLLAGLAGRDPLVKAGDTVLFSWTSGQELHLDDEDTRYLLMREADILAVVE